VSRLWISQHEFVEVPLSRKSLAAEIASRDRSVDFAAALAYLPNPDPVLKKQGRDISIYRDLLVDGHLWAVVQSRQAAVLGREWRIEPADSSRKARRAAEMCQAMLEALPMDAVLEQMLNAVLYGYSIQEIVWEPDGGQLRPARIDAKPQEGFLVGPDGRWRFRARDNYAGEELPEKHKFLITGSHATYRNPYGEPSLSRCFWPATFKKGGWRFWITFGEKYGLPWVVGKLPRGSTEADRQDLLDMLKNMIADAVAAIPADASVEILSVGTAAASPAIYDGLIGKCDAEMSKAILGQTLTTEVGPTGGAFAASQTHMEVRGDLADRDKSLAVDGLNTLLAWIVELNEGDPALAPRSSFVEAEDIRKDLADRDQVLLGQGVRFTKNYYLRQYSLEEEDFELTEPQAQTSGGFPGSQIGQSAFADSGEPGLGLLAERTVAAAAPSLKVIVEKVRRKLTGADSLQQINEQVEEICLSEDPGEVAEYMARAGFVAAADGRIAAGGRHAGG